MLAEAKEASEHFAAEEDVEVEWQRLFHIPPAPFHPDLIALCDEAVHEAAGTHFRLPSGPLHDASYVATSGIPTSMIFVQSLRGLSHTKVEDSREEHIKMGVEALDRLTHKTMGWIQNID
jgi:N-carbamoyl-L-amino-acid hydrolase